MNQNELEKKRVYGASWVEPVIVVGWLPITEGLELEGWLAGGDVERALTKLAHKRMQLRRPNAKILDVKIVAINDGYAGHDLQGELVGMKKDELDAWGMPTRRMLSWKADVQIEAI